MPRRKKQTTEATYTVKKGRDDAGALDVQDDEFDADSGSDALKQAMQDDPNKGSYEKITITKDQGSGRVRTQPKTVSQVKSATEPRTGFESIDYPYHLGLPMGWKPLFESLTKKLQASLTIRDRYGRLHIEVPDATVMESLTTELGKRARGKTTMKEAAGSVLKGINESVNK